MVTYVPGSNLSPIPPKNTRDYQTDGGHIVKAAAPLISASQTQPLWDSVSLALVECVGFYYKPYYPESPAEITAVDHVANQSSGEHLSCRSDLPGKDVMEFPREQKDPVERGRLKQH